MVKFSIWTLFVLTVFVQSCSCNYHLKKVKAKCGISSLTDTLWVKDTTFIDRVTKDTLFKYYTRDTVIVREGRLTMKYFYNSHDSTVYLNGRCDTVFVVKDRAVAVTNNEFTPEQSWHKWLGSILFIVLLIAGLIFRRW